MRIDAPNAFARQKCRQIDEVGPHGEANTAPRRFIKAPIPWQFRIPKGCAQVSYPQADDRTQRAACNDLPHELKVWVEPKLMIDSDPSGIAARHQRSNPR